MLKFLFSFFLVIPVIVISSEKETITFPAADGLQITADVYITKKEE